MTDTQAILLIAGCAVVGSIIALALWFVLKLIG